MDPVYLYYSITQDPVVNVHCTECVCSLNMVHCTICVVYLLLSVHVFVMQTIPCNLDFHHDSSTFSLFI